MKGGLPLNEHRAAEPAVLIVDDAPFFRALLMDLLLQKKYRVVEAASGEEALDLIQSLEIEAVLTDIEMPGMSGPQLLRRIKRLHPDLPVVIISSHQDFEAAREVLRDGALDYLTKPLQHSELFAVVDKALAKHRKSRKSAALLRQAQRRLADLVLLREVGQTASSEANLQRLFEKILDSINDSMDVEIASLMQLEKDGRLHIQAARGLPAKVVADTVVETGEGISGQVLSSGRAVLVEDLKTDRRFSGGAFADRYRTGSVLSVPIRSREKVIGVLNVNNKRSGETFTAADQDLLNTIAYQTGLAMANFELVSNLRRQTRQLEAANLALAKLNQSKSRLVCNLSHELNTPLTTVLGYVDLILNFPDAISAEETRGFLEKVHSESRHMEKLIAGMLRLFSIDSDGSAWDWQTFSLADAIREVWQAYRGAAVQKGLQAELFLDDQAAEIYGDLEKVNILLGALMDNAVKFNRPEGRLWLRLENRQIEGRSYFYLQVHNDGRAIPPEAETEIFDQYTQLGDINTDKPQGIGVGLATCRAIAQRLRGEIRLELTNGEGTTFAVLLPSRETYGELE